MCDAQLYLRKRHRPRWQWLSLLLITVTGGSGGMTPLLHMTSFCSKSLRVNDSLVLDLTENLSPDRLSVGHLSCALSVEAHLGSHLSVHVLQLAISDELETPDRLHIYDVSPSGVSTRITPSTGLYGVLERPYLIYNTAGLIVPDFRSVGSRMRLDYQGRPTVLYRGFRLLITAFNEPDLLGGCEEGTTLCPYSAMCISSRMRCDSFPNCGQNDFEDERSCEKEDIVTNLLEENSLRTALIAGVTGSVVFVLCALTVGFVVLKWNKHKHPMQVDRAIQYTARAESTCICKNESEGAGLHRPPTYENFVPPTHNHSDPPPAYSTIAAPVNVHRGHDGSDDESVKLLAGSPFTQQAPLVLYTCKSQCSSTQPAHHETGSHRADSDDEVRMHGTWPSDTDEEEEVKARRKRKGGKSKNNFKAGSRLQAASQRKGNGGRKRQDDRNATKGIASTNLKPEPKFQCDLCTTPADDIEKSLALSCQCACARARCACAVCASDVTSEWQGETASQTESQCEGHEQSSRTESHSRSVSPPSVHSPGSSKNPENHNYNHSKHPFADASTQNVSSPADTRL